MTSDCVRLLSDEQLLESVANVVGRERATMVRLIELLSELDARRLYLGAGYSSLFTFCTQRLRLSEHAAYGRIEAARAARRFPVILDLLEDGSLTLTAVGLLASHLTDDNRDRVLAAATHKSKREVEQLIATIRPLPTVPSVVRKLPKAKALVSLALAAPAAVEVRPAVHVAGKLPGSHQTSEAAPRPTGQRAAPRPVHAQPRIVPATISPLSPERYKVQITVSCETHDKLRRLQDLLRHAVPDGDPAIIFDRALTLLLQDLERRKLAQVVRPRDPGSTAAGARHVPAAVRRAVWQRDAGQCAFIGSDGRCQERGFLEFHHVVPFARGGAAIAANLQLRCAAHNAYEAQMDFGPWQVRESTPVYELGTRERILLGCTTSVGSERTAWMRQMRHGRIQPVQNRHRSSVMP